jgi:hypothetical protein
MQVTAEKHRYQICSYRNCNCDAVGQVSIAIEGDLVYVSYCTSHEVEITQLIINLRRNVKIPGKIDSDTLFKQVPDTGLKEKYLGTDKIELPIVDTVVEESKEVPDYSWILEINSSTTKRITTLNNIEFSNLAYNFAMSNMQRVSKQYAWIRHLEPTVKFRLEPKVTKQRFNTLMQLLCSEAESRGMLP